MVRTKNSATTPYSELTILMPTFNEAANIGWLLTRLHRLFPDAKLLVVDDDSSDRTQVIVKEFSHKFGQARLISRKGKQRGLTASIIDGILAAQTNHVVVMDGDGQHPPEKISELMQLLETGCDIAVACRKSVPGWSAHRQLLSKGAEFLGRCRLVASNSPSCPDLMSGFFGVKKGFFLQIYSHNQHKFVPGGYKFLFDLLKCSPKTAKIGEVGYIFGTRKGGASKIGSRQCVAFLKSLIS